MNENGKFLSMRIENPVNQSKTLTIAMLLLGTLLLPSLAFGVGGIVSDGSQPYFSDSGNREDFEDMRVKVLGGFVVMTRRWDGEKWNWNHRWNDLTLYNGVSLGDYYDAQDIPVVGSVGETSGGSSALKNSEAIDYTFLWIIRNDFALRRTDLTSNVWVNQNRASLTSNGDLDYFIWKDRLGNKINYDKNGRMQSYSDRNGVTVSLSRDQHHNVQSVQDHHGTTVITYEWETLPATDDEPATHRLLSLTDYTGRKVTYHYDNEIASDSFGQLVRVTDVREKDWQYEYQNEQFVAQVDPDGRRTRYSIDSNGKVVSRFNEDGVGMRYRHNYDSNKEEYYLSQADGAGTVRESWFNGQGTEIRRDINGETQFTSTFILSDNSDGVSNLVESHKPKLISRGSSSSGGGGGGSVSNPLKEAVIPPFNPPYVKSETRTDARGNKTLTTYNQFRNPLKVVYADGSSVNTTWHVNYSIPTEVIDERGVITAYEYDNKGNLVRLTHAKGTEAERITEYGYDSFGQRTSMTVLADNNTVSSSWEYRYDAYGNMTKVIDPLLHETHYSDFDVLGNARVLRDGNSVAANDSYRWTKSFDSVGNLLSDLNPLGQGETYAYSDAGDLLTITAANDSVTTLSTNASGLPTEIEDAKSQTTTLEYDKANRPTSIRDANGHLNARAYDEQGRLKSLTDGEGNVTEYRYQDTLLGSIHYPTYEEALDYDNRNRLKSSTQKANSLEYLRRYGYDVSNNLTLSFDANNQQESYHYDSLDRLIKVTDAKGGNTQFTYDDRDNLLQVEDPEGRLTVYTYNARDELTSETKHNFLNTEKQRRYEYDANGNLIAVINSEQEKTVNHYDASNRLITSEVFAHKDDAKPIKRVSYGYNTDNQYTGYQQALGDAASGQTPDVIALSESYVYNELNQLTQVTVDFGAFQKSYNYTYYPNGLKRTYTNPEGETYTYYYNKNNQFQAVIIPGHGQMSIDSFQWLAPQSIQYPGASVLSWQYDDLLRQVSRELKDPAQTSLASASYSYDKESNITEIDTEHGDYDFGYDELYRLTSADYPEAAAANDEGFGYDGVGNRTEHTQNSTIETLSYNDYNQLTGDSAGAVFTYNDNGHTVTKTHNGTITEYVYNREERLIAVKQDGVVVGEYVYNPYGQRVRKIAGGTTTWFLYNDEGLAGEYADDGSLIKEYHFKPYSTWMTEPLFQRSGDGRMAYYQNDHLGTPQRMIESGGAVVWEGRYSAFGEAEVLVGSVKNNLRFPGQYFDEESGLHHNYFRDYDPSSGRYVQGDPIGQLGGLNIYVYAYSSPIIAIDHSGLQTDFNHDGFNDVTGMPINPPVPPAFPLPPNPPGMGDLIPQGQATRRTGRVASLIETVVASAAAATAVKYKLDRDGYDQRSSSRSRGKRKYDDLQRRRIQCELRCHEDFPAIPGLCSEIDDDREDCQTECWAEYRRKLYADPDATKYAMGAI